MMNDMNKTELRAAVKSLGWSLITRQKWNRKYFYAAKRIGGKRVEKYLFPESRVKDKQQADVWAKLL